MAGGGLLPRRYTPSVFGPVEIDGYHVYGPEQKIHGVCVHQLRTDGTFHRVFANLYARHHLYGCFYAHPGADGFFHPHGNGPDGAGRILGVQRVRTALRPDEFYVQMGRLVRYGKRLYPHLCQRGRNVQRCSVRSKHLHRNLCLRRADAGRQLCICAVGGNPVQRFLCKCRGRKRYPGVYRARNLRSGAKRQMLHGCENAELLHRAAAGGTRVSGYHHSARQLFHGRLQPDGLRLGSVHL